MAKIKVKAKIDGGIHLKYGPIVKGQEYEIEEEHFGDQLFERPPGFESPLEKAEREKMTSDQRPVISDQPAEKAKGPRSPVSGPELKEGGE